MYNWRITKYNPLNRDEFGSYNVSDEWTSFSEVGTKLSEEEYLIIERNYLDAIGLFLKELGIEKIQIIELENWLDEKTNRETSNFLSELSTGDIITSIEAKRLAQLTLREAVWCKLEFKGQFYVHFGYDYYMYIGAVKPCKQAILTIQQSGLYVEKFESPYKEEKNH